MWQAIGASVAGTSHLRTGLPCQDAHRFRLLEHGVIAAVADGLGSAARSEEGARLATETVLTVLGEAVAAAPPGSREEWEALFAEAFARARQQLEQAAEESGEPLRDYGTTLLAVVATPEWLCAGHVGDGVIVALLKDGTLETVSMPQRGEYANEVMPLTAVNALDAVRISVREISVRAVALLSDGLQNLSVSMATGTPYAPFFRPFFDAITHPVDTVGTEAELVAFLGSERVCARTDDDKTVVVIGKTDPAPEENQPEAEL